MKNTRLLALILLGIVTNLHAVEFVTDKDLKKIEEEKDRREHPQLYPEFWVGKKFWFVPSKFVNKVFYFCDSDMRRTQTSDGSFGYFAIVEESEVEVIDYHASSDGWRKYKYLLRFPDDKIACIENENMHMYDPTESPISAPIFDHFYSELPTKVHAKERKQAAEARAKRQAKGGVRVGMSKSEVLASNWGKPEKINKTTNQNGTQEQWVYGSGNYLYFENGVLSSIQN